MVSQSAGAVARMSPVAIGTAWAAAWVLFGSDSRRVLGTSRGSSASRHGRRRAGWGADAEAAGSGGPHLGVRPRRPAPWGSRGVVAPRTAGPVPPLTY